MALKRQNLENYCRICSADGDECCNFIESLQGQEGVSSQDLLWKKRLLKN